MPTLHVREGSVVAVAWVIRQKAVRSADARNEEPAPGHIFVVKPVCLNNPLTADRVKSVATTGLFDADCQLNAQSSTCDYVFPAWEKRVCAWFVNVF